MTIEQTSWDKKWDKIKELGEGGQGKTFLVKRKEAPFEEAALKILNDNTDSKARGRMHREVANLQVLSSAGGAVPTVIEHNTNYFDDPKVNLYLIMQYISGQTLEKFIGERKMLTLELATKVISCICKTIEIGHTFPILHRDLKPDNIIVRDFEKGDVVIIDYGLSFNSNNFDLTVVNESMRNKFLSLSETNTPNGNRRDPRSDVTAVCAIFYYMLTGNIPGHLLDSKEMPPHKRAETLLKNTHGSISSFQLLEALFNCGFSPNINNRFQTIAEFRDRLILINSTQLEFQEEDPIEKAKKASVLFRQRDRATQLREFQRPAAEIIISLHQFANAYKDKLESFSLSVEEITVSPKEQTNNIDIVGTKHLRLQLNPAYQNHLRVAIYYIGSRGEQCVVLRRNQYRDDVKDPVIITGLINELIWYNANEKPDLKIIYQDIKSWLNKSIQDLTDLVIPE